MSKTVQKLDTGILKTHPWQKNIPDMKGNDWDEFLEDVRENGIQHPITISNRTGEHVAVDGHQRLRAAKEVGLKEIEVIVKPFQNELDEIYFIVLSNKRRQLSKPQRIAIALSLKEAIAEQAPRNVGGRPKKNEDKKPPQNFGEVSDEKPANSQNNNAHNRETDAALAEMANTNREDVRKGSKIINEAPTPVKEAWEREELSTHAAHKLTLAAKTDSELYEALESGEIVPLGALETLKAKEKTKKEGTDAKEDTKEEKEETKPQEETKESIPEVAEEAEESEELTEEEEEITEESTGEVNDIAEEAFLDNKGKPARVIKASLEDVMDMAAGTKTFDQVAKEKEQEKILEQELNGFLETILSKGTTSHLEQLIKFLEQALREKQLSAGNNKTITVVPVAKPIGLTEAVEVLLSYSREQLEAELDGGQLEQLQAICTPKASELITDMEF